MPAHWYVNSPPRSSRAFTLLELMIGVAVASLLASIAIPSYQAYVERTNVVKAITDIAAAQGPLQQFYSHNFRYPDTLAEAGLANFNDPWGNPYQYLNIADSGSKTPKGVRKDKNLHPLNSDYDLYSMGADGKNMIPLTAKASRDDVIRASDGSFIDLAENY